MITQRFVFTIFFVLTTTIFYSQSSFAKPAGEAKMVIGKVTVQTANGESVRLKRGGSISEGDTIITDERAQAQLIMVDGTNISVRPGSQFKIEEFVATGNIEKDKTHYAIAQGGFRSITGSIGKKNKESFQLKTPVATMGIRGTDFTAKYCKNDCPASGGKNGLFLDVISGGVSMANESGTFNYTPDTNGYVSDNKSKPGKIDNLPDNLLSPNAKKREKEEKTKDKKHKNAYPSAEEELVQISIYVAPEQKKEIIEEAMAAGVPPKEVINGANNGGLEANQILPDLLESGKKHGLSPTDLVQPIMDSNIKSSNIIKDLMSANPELATDILTAAIASGEANNDELKAIASGLGISSQDINAAQALGGLLAIPPEVKEMLQEADGTKSGTNSIRARELAPSTNTQNVASPD